VYHVKAHSWNARLYKHLTATVGTRLIRDISNAVISPDGRTLAINIGNSRLEFWDAIEGKRYSSLTPQESWDHGFDGDDPYEERERMGNDWGGCMDFSPDGSELVLSGGCDINFRVEVPSGRLLGVFREYQEGGHMYSMGDIFESKFVPGGKLIKVEVLPCQATTGDIRILKCSTLEQVYEAVIGHWEFAYAHDVAPDGKTFALVTVNSTGAVRISVVDITRKVATHLDAPSGTAPPQTNDPGITFPIAFSPQPGARWLATAHRDNVVRVWDLSCGKLTFKALQHQHWPHFAWVASGQYILTGTEDGKLHIWDPTSASKLIEVNIGDRVGGLDVHSHTNLRPMVVTRNLDFVRIWRADFTTVPGLVSAIPHPEGPVVISIETACEHGLLVLIRVLGHASGTDLTSCDLEGAVLTNAWKV